ncbi:NDP-sugar dehydratase or epimerase [Spirochaetia bacterium]|nr:NDP-sugar dehydratase or epimerase [Spirochaetia bacterium]
MNNLKILITGASGFIGTNLVVHFSSLGYTVRNFDIVTPKDKEYISLWHRVDITNYDIFMQGTKEFSPDYIIHLAARTDLNGKNAGAYSANTIGVDNLLKIVQQLPNLKKILITSSMLVCGLGYKPDDQFDYHPTTVYGESKVITEKNVWNNKPPCDWAILRPTSIWGEWFDIPYKNFFDMVIARRYFHIDEKSCTKTYGYVGNAAYQIERILLSNTTDESNKVFYIGDYQRTNIEEWANEIADELNYKILTVPYFLVFIAALCGDLLKKLRISFPMTTFRLHNMTTDNIVDLSNTTLLAPRLPYSRIQGIKRTLKWIKKECVFIPPPTVYR